MLGEAAAKILVGTFHSVCHRMLRQYGSKFAIVPQDFNLLDQAASTAWVKRIVEDMNAANPGLDDVKLDPKMLATRFAQHKNEAGFESRSVEQGEEKVWKGHLNKAFELYQATLRDRGLLDFADLLLAGLRLAMVCPAVQNFLYVSVDEFQDTNRLQFLLAKQWSLRHGNILVVGDMEQSIYVWRGRAKFDFLRKAYLVLFHSKGATPVSNFADFFSHFKNSSHGTNYANYRSTQAICVAANSITANSELFSMRKVKTELKPMVLGLSADKDVPASQVEAAMVAREIGRTVGLGSAAFRTTTSLSSFAPFS